MRYTVLQDFHSDVRRFHVGDVVDVSEITGPVSVERWLEMGRIEEMKPVKPDLASDQVPLRVVWESKRDTELAQGDPIFIADQALYGTLISNLDGPGIIVHVFGEAAFRRYSVVALDRTARSVTGEFGAEHMTRRARAAMTAAASERVNADPVAVEIATADSAEAPAS